MPFRSWLLMLLAIVATLGLSLSGVRYASLAEVLPSLADETVRRVGNPAVDGVAGGFLLSAVDDRQHRGLIWTILPVPGALALRVRGEVVLDAVSAGGKRWERAHVAVRQMDAQKKAVERSVFAGSGSLVQHVDAVVPLQFDAVQVDLMARLLKVSGSMTVSGLRLDWLVERPWVPLAMLVLWVLWLLAFGDLMVRWLLGARYRPALILVFGLVLAAILMPGNWRDMLEMWVAGLLPVKPGGLGGLGLSDFVHFGMFLLLGLALALARPDVSPGWLLVDLVLLAAATEVVQLLVLERQASWADFAVDSLGAALGVLLAFLVERK